jgi:putative Ca2+/H+ antiporter (TMEM165/GDT1 family)
MTALAAMTILSALMGVIVPNILSVRVTQWLAVILFFGFGAKILRDTLKTSGEESSEDEMAEAQAALGKKSDDVETGSSASSNSERMTPAANRWKRCLNPVLVQAFTLTFIAEWGDRSQVATIALAAAKNAYGVTVGGILGHAICTGGAVLSGNMIAQRVSHKTVNIVGGSLFIFFSLVTLYEIVTHSHHLEQQSVTPSPH